MKAIKFFASLLMLFTLSLGVSAQTLTKAQEKAVKKQVKEFQKEGWKVKPGSLSLADQITRSTQAQMEQNADGYEKWIIGEGSSVGTIYDAARTQALTVAQVFDCDRIHAIRHREPVIGIHHHFPSIVQRAKTIIILFFIMLRHTPLVIF